MKKKDKDKKKKENLNRGRNRKYITSIKNINNSSLEILKNCSKDKSDVNHVSEHNKTLSKFNSTVDKAVGRKIIHKKNASRKKRKLSILFNDHLNK